MYYKSNGILHIIDYSHHHNSIVNIHIRYLTFLTMLYYMSYKLYLLYIFNSCNGMLDITNASYHHNNHHYIYNCYLNSMIDKLSYCKCYSWQLLCRLNISMSKKNIWMGLLSYLNNIYPCICIDQIDPIFEIRYYHMLNKQQLHYKSDKLIDNLHIAHSYHHHNIYPMNIYINYYYPMHDVQLNCKLNIKLIMSKQHNNMRIVHIVMYCYFRSILLYNCISGQLDLINDYLINCKMCMRLMLCMFGMNIGKTDIKNLRNHHNNHHRMDNSHH